MQATKVADLPGPNSRMPLHVAVLKSLPGIVQILVNYGASPLSRDRERTTPIGLAAKTGSVQILEIFMAIIPESELFDATSGPDNSSLLHLAVQSQDLDVVFYLLKKGVSRRSKNLYGQTAAHIASRLGNPRILRHLLESDQWLRDESTPDGFTPLHELVVTCLSVGLSFLLKCTCTNTNTMYTERAIHLCVHPSACLPRFVI